MVEKETTVEKRKYDRFKAQKDTYIVIENSSTDLGQMINISNDGLAFSYIGTEEQIAGWHKVRIFLNSKLSG